MLSPGRVRWRLCHGLLSIRDSLGSSCIGRQDFTLLRLTKFMTTSSSLNSAHLLFGDVISSVMTSMMMMMVMMMKSTDANVLDLSRSKKKTPAVRRSARIDREGWEGISDWSSEEDRAPFGRMKCVVSKSVLFKNERGRKRMVGRRCFLGAEIWGLVLEMG